MKNEKYIERWKIISECFNKYPFMKDEDFTRLYKAATDEKFLELLEYRLNSAKSICKDQIEDLWDEGVEFLRKYLNVTVDINTLSDEEFKKLQNKLHNIEYDEAMKVDKLPEGLITWEDGRQCSVSEHGANAMRIASYMSSQYYEGGRRYKTT